jgi:hypothetical protein
MNEAVGGHRATIDTYARQAITFFVFENIHLVYLQFRLFRLRMSTNHQLTLRNPYTVQTNRTHLTTKYILKNAQISYLLRPYVAVSLGLLSKIPSISSMTSGVNFSIRSNALTFS